MSADIILVIVVATALAFDFTNGFHDTANVVATSISTRALPPRPAIALAALLNFVGAFISLKVAATVGKGFVDAHDVTTTVVFAGLVGAITWNLVTWYLGLPSSSSHALIGGLVGSVIAAHGFGAVNGDGPARQAHRPGADRPAAGLRGRRTGDRARLPDRRRPSPGPGQPRVPARPARLRRPAGALARDQRRPEDDGRDHAGADRPRRHLDDRLPRPDLGGRRLRRRDRARAR